MLRSGVNVCKDQLLNITRKDEKIKTHNFSYGEQYEHTHTNINYTNCVLELVCELCCSVYCHWNTTEREKKRDMPEFLLFPNNAKPSCVCVCAVQQHPPEQNFNQYPRLDRVG